MEETIVRQLPKIELHCHLDGSIRGPILETLAITQGRPLPYTGDALIKKMSAPDTCDSLAEYLERFDLVLPYLQTTDALELVAFDLIQQAHEEAVAYIEVRFAPMLFTRQQLSLPEIISAVLKGLKKGEEAFGVKSNALLCGMRHHSEEENTTVVHAAHDFSHKGVVGFDLAGDEAPFPAEDYTEVITLARHFDIPLTLHAGECGCAQNIATSIHLGASRIGHGIAAIKDPNTMDLCRENNILIEMCPTSNLQTKAIKEIADYPFQQFLDAGLKICVNTDNRTVSNTTLTREYMTLHRWFGIDYNCMAQVNHHAVDGAFISPKEKEALHQLIDTAYQTIN